jgi:hypothetical protein
MLTSGEEKEEMKRFRDFTEQVLWDQRNDIMSKLSVECLSRVSVPQGSVYLLPRICERQ